MVQSAGLHEPAPGPVMNHTLLSLRLIPPKIYRRTAVRPDYAVCF